jgi:hypothetical protein
VGDDGHGRADGHARSVARVINPRLRAAASLFGAGGRPPYHGQKYQYKGQFPQEMSSAHF